MITLELWGSDVQAYDQIGSGLVQSGTLMHELGHNLGLSHAGIYRAPVCMPNYPSVMIYLYQTRGLTDANGLEHIDYSYGTLLPLKEGALSETSALSNSPLNYKIRYYGPSSRTIRPIRRHSSSGRDFHPARRTAADDDPTRK